MKVVVAITGASGAIYARQTVQLLEKDDKVESIALIFSDNGEQVMKYEQGDKWITECKKVTILRNNDFYTSPASGSAHYDALVVVPSSVGSMSRIALGISDSLITRAADVMLKERRKLIIVLRETPLSLIHINNMKLLTEAGAVILPAAPSFYHSPKDIEELTMSVAKRIIALLGLDSGKGWME